MLSSVRPPIFTAWKLKALDKLFLGGSLFVTGLTGDSSQTCTLSSSLLRVATIGWDGYGE